jgi:hypothetical protein
MNLLNVVRRRKMVKPYGKRYINLIAIILPGTNSNCVKHYVIQN